MPVIDRINGLSAADTQVNNRKVQDAGSKETGGFALPDEDIGGVIYEPGTLSRPKPKTMAEIREEIAREEAAAAKANLHARFDGPGVAVELSTDSYEAAAKPAEQSIGAILRDTWRSIVNFFLSIWNGGDTKTKLGVEAGTDTVTEDAGLGADITDAAAEASPDVERAYDGFVPFADAAGASEGSLSVRSNSPEDIAAFMTDYGGARLAKNSDLLTQYDRRGQIVNVDPSDRKRILHGEGRVRRY